MSSEKITREQCLQWIRQEKAERLEEAHQICDAFMSAQRSARADPDKTQHTYIGSRVRVVGKTLSCEWFRYTPKAWGNKKVVMSNYIPMNRQSKKYSLSKFKNEPAWAQQLIALSEKRYAELRICFQTLNKIERMLESLK